MSNEPKTPKKDQRAADKKQQNPPSDELSNEALNEVSGGLVPAVQRGAGGGGGAG